MDDSTQSTLNGAQNVAKKSSVDDSKEKVNRTLLLKQQIEENRLRVLQREKEISDSKKSLEKLFTQIDRSFSGTALNVLAEVSNETKDVRDAKDVKISQLEASISSLKSEKKDLEMRLLGLETIQETKDCLQLEVNELHTRLETALKENSMLNDRVQQFRELEDENDELKIKVDKLCSENSSLKSELLLKETAISDLEKHLEVLKSDVENQKIIAISSEKNQLIMKDLEIQASKLAEEKHRLEQDCETWRSQLDELSLSNASLNSAAQEAKLLVEELEKKLAEISKEKDELKQEYETMRSMTEVSNATHKNSATDEKSATSMKEVPEVATEMKVSTLGSKKPKSKRGRSAQQRNNEPESRKTEEPVATSNQHQLSALESEIQLLNGRILVLEGEKSELQKTANELEARAADLDGQILILGDQLASSNAEKQILQQRLDVLLAEINADTLVNNNNDIANLQTMLHLKEQECAELFAKYRELQTERDLLCQRVDDADNEVFKLKMKCRDAEYVLNNKDETIHDLELRLETQTMTATSTSDEVQQLAKTISKLEEKLSSAESKISQYETRLLDKDKTATETVAHLQEALQNLRQELESVETELARRIESYEKLEKACTNYQKELTDKVTEVQQLKDELQQAEVVLAEQDAKFKSVLDEVNRLKMSADSNDCLSRFETELNQYHMDREMLQNDLHTKSFQLEECNKNVEHLEVLLKEAKSKEMESLTLNETLSAQLKTSEDKLAQVSEKFKKLAANYKQKLQVIQQLEKKVEAYKNAGASNDDVSDAVVRVRLLEAEEEIKTLREQLDAQKESIDQLRQTRLELERAESDLNRGRDELDSMKQELQRILEERNVLNDQLNEAQQKALHFEEEAERIQRDFQNYTASMEQLENELAEARLQPSTCQKCSDLESVRLELEKTRKVTEDQAKLMDRLRRELSELNEEKEELEERNNELENKIDGMRTQLSALHDAFNANFHETTALQGQLSDMLKAKQELIERNLQLEENLSQLKEQLGNANSVVDGRLDEMSSLLEQCGVLSREKAEMTQRNAELEVEVLLLREQFSFIQNELATATSEKKNQSQSIAELQEELHSTRNQLSELSPLRDQLEESIQNSQSFLNKVVALERQLDEQNGHLIQVIASRDSALADIETLRRQLEESRNENKNLEDVRSTTCHRLREFEALLAQKDQEIESIQSHYTELSANSAENSALRNQINELESERNVLKEHVQLLANQIQSFESLHQQLGQATWERDQFSEQLTMLAKSIDVVQKESDELRESLQTVSLERDQLISQLTELRDVHDQCSGHLQEIAQLRQALNNSQEQADKIEGIQRDLISVTAAKENLLEEVSLKDSELQDLRQQLEKIQGELFSSQEQLSETLNRCQWENDIQFQLETTRAELSRAQEQLNEAMGANDKTTELQAQLDATQKTIDELLAEKSRMLVDIQEIGMLRIQLAELTSEQDDLNYQLEDYQNQVSMLEAKLTEDGEVRGVLESTVSSLGTKVNELQAELAKKTQENIDFESQIATLTSEKLELSNKLATAEDTILKLQAVQIKLEAANNEIQEYEASLTNLRQQIEASNSQLEALNAKSEIAHSALAEAEAKHRSLLDEYNVKINCISHLEKNLEQVISQRDELSAELLETRQNLRTQVESLEFQVSELTNEKTASAERLSAFEEQRNQYAVLKKELDDALALCEKYKTESADAEILLNTFKSQSEELSLLRVNLFETMTERDELQTSLSSLEEELNSIRENLARSEASCREVGESKAKLESSLATLNEDLVASQRELAESIQIRQELEEQKRSLQSVLSSNEEELRILREKRVDLESNVSSMDEELRLLRLECSELASKCEELESSQLDAGLLDEMKNRLTQVTGKCESLTRSEEEWKDRCSILEKDKTELMEKCSEWQEKYATLELGFANHADELRTKSNEKFALLETEHSKIVSQLNASEEGRIWLQQRLDECEKTKQELMENQTKMQEELAQLRMAVFDLTSERDELQASIDELEETRIERDQLNLNLLEAEEKLAESTSLRITISELSMERDELAAQVAHISDEKSKQFEDLTKQLNEMSSRLVQTEQRMSEVTHERDRLQQSSDRDTGSPSRAPESRGISVESNYEKGQLETQEVPSGDELVALRKQVAALESELHETKVKAAKSLRQVKLLKSELSKCKKEPKNDDYFSSAVEEELRKQVADTEKLLTEKVKDIERLLLKIDTLEGANERFLMSKESQDNEIALLQQRNRELLAQISSLEWDNSGNEKQKTSEIEPVATATESSPVWSSRANEIEELETKINQLADDNEQYQDLLEELKAEREAIEANLKGKIRHLETQLEEKSRMLESLGSGLDNKDRFVSGTYDEITSMNTDLSALYSELSNLRAIAATVEDLKKENENLVDMIRQLSTTGTLDAATLQRLKEEINHSGEQNAFHSSDGDASGDELIDWHGAFNELQIEVEYLRSQNSLLLRQIQEAGLPVWDGVEGSESGSEIISTELSDQEQIRSELDSAVRNLHERDMRCQELTWEITKLLEERDTLQLRLSNALRQNHEMQEQLKEAPSNSSAAGIEASSPAGDLTAKLNELKKLNYSLDVQLKREQEERQKIEQQLMALYGTRSNSPYSATNVAAAGGRTVKSSSHRQDNPDEFFNDELNASRESLRSSQVLSEWLKGKNDSPKVQHI